MDEEYKEVEFCVSWQLWCPSRLATLKPLICVICRNAAKRNGAYRTSSVESSATSRRKRLEHLSDAQRKILPKRNLHHHRNQVCWRWSAVLADRQDIWKRTSIARCTVSVWSSEGKSRRQSVIFVRCVTAGFQINFQDAKGPYTNSAQYADSTEWQEIAEP